MSDRQNRSGDNSIAPLPGDLSREEKLHRMLRVDHAGEYGAVRIYAGQRAVLGDDHPMTPTIDHMAEQEDRHLDTFNKILVERRVRPTALAPLWHVAGYALGAGTALLGEKAAMACTAAVEEVIDEHYESQLEALEAEDPKLADTVREFQAEEVEHRDIALQHGAEDTPGYALLSSAIKTGCRAAIWLSKRV